MLVVQCSLNIVNGRIWHTASLKDIQPLLSGLLDGSAFNHAVDFRSVLYSVAVGNEASICLPLREAQSITKYTKEPVIATAKQDISILSLVAPVRHNGC